MTRISRSSSFLSLPAIMARMGKFMFSMAISFLISDTDSFEFCNPYRLCGVCMRIYEPEKKYRSTWPIWTTGPSRATSLVLRGQSICALLRGNQFFGPFDWIDCERFPYLIGVGHHGQTRVDSVVFATSDQLLKDFVVEREGENRLYGDVHFWDGSRIVKIVPI